jgi:anti-sigma B factor antagonist
MISTKLSIRARDGHIVITLRGELDLVDAPYVAAALAAATDRDPWAVVDLTNLEFIDCSGVAALARGRRQARQAGGDLLLAAPRPQVMRILMSTALAHDFSFYATVEEAVSGVESSRGTAVLAPSRLPAAWSRRPDAAEVPFPELPGYGELPA